MVLVLWLAQLQRNIIFLLGDDGSSQTIATAAVSNLNTISLKSLLGDKDF